LRFINSAQFRTADGHAADITRSFSDLAILSVGTLHAGDCTINSRYAKSVIMNDGRRFDGIFDGQAAEGLGSQRRRHRESFVTLQTWPLNVLPAQKPTPRLGAGSRRVRREASIRFPCLI
jgi:hypothetical protein